MDTFSRFLQHRGVNIELRVGALCCYVISCGLSNAHSWPASQVRWWLRSSLLSKTYMNLAKEVELIPDLHGQPLLEA